MTDLTKEMFDGLELFQVKEIAKQFDVPFYKNSKIDAVLKAMIAMSDDINTEDVQILINGYKELKEENEAKAEELEIAETNKKEITAIDNANRQVDVYTTIPTMIKAFRENQDFEGYGKFVGFIVANLQEWKVEATKMESDLKDKIEKPSYVQQLKMNKALTKKFN